MQTVQRIDNPLLRDTVGDLKKAMGEHLLSVVLYGSAARGEFQKKTSDFNLLVVVDSLEAEILEGLSPVISRWVRRGQPFPRLFSPELIRNSTDVFPIEFLEIRAHHKTLYGTDPLEQITVRTDHLRLWCERELREKMMRLREAYMASRGKPKVLRRLLVESYSIFLAIFRGCLRLLGGEIPARSEEVVRAFCERAGLEPAPFEAIRRLRRGEKLDIDPKRLFSEYYGGLMKAVDRVDRFVVETGEEIGDQQSKQAQGKGGR